MEVEFEYTAPGTPQQNGLVEWKFAILFNRVFAMFNGGKFSAFLRNGLWAEAVSTASHLQNNLVTTNRDLSPFQQFWGKEREASCLRVKKLVKCTSLHTGITYTSLS